MKKVIEFDQKCERCNGTGIYVGIAERDGAGVVCSTCKGTGCFHFKHEYEEFKQRETRGGIYTVHRTNPGIVINGDIDRFGGITYIDWLSGQDFELGTENRNCVCPSWWYQNTDYKLKPEWSECHVINSFSSCEHFSNKSKCWKRFDKEQK